ncbi:Protein kinase C-like, phorbol ester/diacylglycerol binding protein [Corchorus olitorius]|uniref:Protein kinase C-like, phorbol ester/diacylglycerol binding protein n=1 Tax=Corchorus olitorius TaxID=93759 RepID=A0A1R3KAZ6_9ROSI|nr:Protein kinase C-like, phorbol ester/diacylglycerol binding protein [Corchorus olitorius]
MYKCSSNYCYFRLDIKCALLLHNIDENFNFRELKHFGHQHPLTLIENPDDQLVSRADCYRCRKPLVESLYVCLQSECRFYLHKKCAKLPALVDHPCHPSHPFILQCPSRNLPSCKVCEEDEYVGLFLRCSPCKLDIHIKCAWPPPIIEDRSHHDHPFLRFFRTDMFTCNACGVDGNYFSYICPICNIQVHPNCTSLPHIIKTTRHHHRIIHKYFLQSNQKEVDCQICFTQVKTKHGSFSCLKQDCNFVAHVKCAMEDDMYDVIDENEEEEEESSDEKLGSMITSVIERNQNGDATKIQHSCHAQHVLTLLSSIDEDDALDLDDKHCDGCMLSMSTCNSSFYSCCEAECDFLLHKTCAELPRIMHLWFQRGPCTLESVDFFFCGRCDRLYSGFAYKSDEGRPYCLRCARVNSHSLTFPGHPHTLVFDFKFRGKCNGCGARCDDDGAFKCYRGKDCTNKFGLDFACITLPETTRHKCDQHLLTLAFHEKKQQDPEQHYCDVCEEKRDPNLWFYHCAICDKSAHPTCVLGEYPFFNKKKMIGSTLPNLFSHPHEHDLNFVKKMDEICSHCGNLIWEDIAVECKHCNYIIHFECCEPYPWRQVIC